MLQRSEACFLFLLGALQRLVLSPEFLNGRSKLSVLGFQLLDPALQPRDVCFHPLVLRLEHAGVENDSSEMRGWFRNWSLFEVNAYEFSFLR